ncbi:dephospho-CoA kinase [Legionella sp.]|uniref:dephospho-CoA kinase n=1 Tax=Legionella sp. TaxID=459 RepID=UPI003C9FE6FB
MVYCVGLTGSIASGKSTVAELFINLGVQVINADKISKELTAKNQTIYKKIITRYGKEILNKEGELNRRRLRSIIFSDPKERYWLEQLMHPMIRQKIKQQVISCRGPYCIVEIPLLIDKKNYPYINRILLINAPIDTQISRIIQRDQSSREDALAILAAQPNINLYIQNANDILVNDLRLEKLKTSVQNFHQKYLQLSQTSGPTHEK